MKKLSVLLFNQGGRCFYCDAILDLGEATIDHVIPQSKGGSDEADNLVVCCKYANRAFGDCSPKQKIAVAKTIGFSKVGCQGIFPRENRVTPENPLSADKPANLPSKPVASLNEAYHLLHQAIESLVGVDITSSQLKNQMRKLDPLFKESDYGFSQFSKFLLQAQKDKMVVLQKHGSGNNYIIKKV